METRNGSYEMVFLEQFSAVASYFDALPLHPVFNIVHLSLTAFALRNEPGGVQFAQGHPVASYVLTLMIASSGGILANVVLAKPLVVCILDMRYVMTSLVTWYLIFFSPLDICYGLCHFTPVSLVLWALKELARVKKIYQGVVMAASAYPQSILAMAIVGMLKGSGKQWGMIWYHAVSSPHLQPKHELLGISYTTKSSLLLGLVLAYNHAHPTFDPTHLVLLSGCVFVVIKLWYRQVANFDPFLLSQSSIWGILTYLSIAHPLRDVAVSGATRLQDSGGAVRLQDVGGATEPTEKEKSVEKAKHLKHD